MAAVISSLAVIQTGVNPVSQEHFGSQVVVAISNDAGVTIGLVVALQHDMG